MYDKIEPRILAQHLDEAASLTDAEKATYLQDNGWTRVEGTQFLWDGDTVRMGIDAAVRFQRAKELLYRK